MPESDSDRNPQHAGERFPASAKSYAYRLGMIGRQLDDAKCRSVAITEVSGSFIVRATDRKDGTMQLSEIVEEDFLARSRPRFGKPDSDSYEAMFAIIGSDLDERVAANVGVIERQEMIQVVGWVHGEAAGQASYVVFHHAYSRADLQHIASQI